MWSCSLRVRLSCRERVRPTDSILTSSLPAHTGRALPFPISFRLPLTYLFAATIRIANMAGVLLSNENRHPCNTLKAQFRANSPAPTDAAPLPFYQPTPLLSTAGGQPSPSPSPRGRGDSWLFGERGIVSSPRGKGESSGPLALWERVRVRVRRGLSGVIRSGELLIRFHFLPFASIPTVDAGDGAGDARFPPARERRWDDQERRTFNSLPFPTICFHSHRRCGRWGRGCEVPACAGTTMG